MRRGIVNLMKMVRATGQEPSGNNAKRTLQSDEPRMATSQPTWRSSSRLPDGTSNKRPNLFVAKWRRICSAQGCMYWSRHLEAHACAKGKACTCDKARPANAIMPPKGPDNFSNKHVVMASVRVGSSRNKRTLPIEA